MEPPIKILSHPCALLHTARILENGQWTITDEPILLETVEILKLLKRSSRLLVFPIKVKLITPKSKL